MFRHLRAIFRLKYEEVYIVQCHKLLVHFMVLYFIYIYIYIYIYTGCLRRNVEYFGRVFLMLNYTDITQNTYIQS